MTPAEIFPYLTGAGGALFALLAGIFALLTGRVIPASVHDAIMAGKDAQIRDLTAAVAAERAKGDASLLAAQTTNGILQALHETAARR